MSEHENGQGESFATWWRPLTRREFAEGTLGLAAIAAIAGVQSGCCAMCGPRTPPEPPEAEEVKDSLALQKENGWAIGQEEKPLLLPGMTDSDSKGGQDWRKYLSADTLIAALTPVADAWKPFFVPTLIQALAQTTLATKMGPVVDPAMQEAYARGGSIAHDLLPATEKANTTLMVIDLPGRQAVAMAAGMSDTANVVMTFDNWPHPIGVVPSQETLGAMLYYASEIEANKAKVKPDAPTVVVLDSLRITPYTDSDKQFDNRYMAKMPEAAQLSAQGITNLLYITPDRTVERELDDLNELFVDYKKASVNVALMPASDLQKAQEPEKKTITTETGQKREVVYYRYYYGGYPHTHFYFFTYYPLWVYRPAYFVRTGIMYRGAMRPPAFARPMYAPVMRPTAFAGARMGGRGGVGRARPSGFGRTSVRTSGGRVVGVRAGRSGSFGRSGG
ncbi:MAG TPA: hypothetical protein VGQ83_30330 [Polyangia bacterium]|jgi:hypothetical protein